MATCLQWRRNENMFPSDFNSICFKCNILVRAAAIPASKTTPVEAEKVTYWTFSFPRHQQHHSLSGWLYTTCYSTMTNNLQAPDFSDCCIICVGSTGAGKSSTVGEISPCLGTNASWMKYQLQQQNKKIIIKSVFSSPKITISRPTRGNWCWRWLPRKMHGSSVQVRLRNGTSDKTLWDT